MCLDTKLADMETTNESVIGQLQRVVNKILFLKKKRLFQFQGVEFFPSEVHLMLVIKEKIATNATRMAEQLGVTKGAVSQALTRLEKKGVLIKTKDPSNKNELTLAFTPFGAKVFKHYSDRAADLFNGPEDFLDQLSDAERRAIQSFLVEVERAFERVAE